MKLNNESLLSLEKYWMLPAFLGFIVGLAIFAFEQLYEFLHEIFSIVIDFNPMLILACPVIALLGAYLIIYFIAENKGCGCGTELLIERYHHKNGIVSARDTVARVLASALTIAFGGSAGLEGSSLLLGGGLSSVIMRRLKLTPKDVKTLFLCGAAAGFSAIFKAPLTGMLFALEIPYKRDVETEVLVPAAISSVSAYIVSASIMGTEAIFPSGMLFPASLSSLLHAVILGICTGFVGLIFIESLEKVGIGIYGLLSKRHLLKVLISIELIAVAASMNFVMLASEVNKALGEAFLIIAFSTDTCVTAIVLAIMIYVSRKYGTCDLEKLAEMEEECEAALEPEG